ncbi:MAG: hypothetical protein IIA88_09900, partial [Bacteroidetes bacterium]|nr:hypothetical protein [Bacteroidota bacterium]
MKIKTFYILLLLFVFIMVTCRPSFLKFPAIPNEPMSASEEIKYIHETDQRDRMQNLHRLRSLSQEKRLENKKILAMLDRDSIRLTRIIELNEKGLIRTDADKYFAAYTYFHAGGPKMKNDTIYLRIAYELFKDLAENATDEKFKKQGQY